jgi:hypothetical protein
MRLLRSARAGIAVACASTLAAATLVPAATAASKSSSAEAPLQSISIKVAKKAITVRGAKGLDAGRIKVAVTGRGVAEILMFDKGYDFGDFMKDVGKFESKNDIKALKRALRNTEILGGVQPGFDGTIVLPKAGDYTVFSFASRGHAEFSAAAGRAPRRRSTTRRSSVAPARSGAAPARCPRRAPCSSRTPTRPCRTSSSCSRWPRAPRPTRSSSSS